MYNRNNCRENIKPLNQYFFYLKLVNNQLYILLNFIAFLLLHRFLLTLDLSCLDPFLSTNKLPPTAA